MTLRHRDRGNPVVYQTTTKTSNGSVIDTGVYEGSTWSESITDVSTPNYAKRIAAGEIINNPCSYLYSEVDSPSGGNYSATGYGYVVKTSGGNLTAYQTDAAARYQVGNPWMAIPDRPKNLGDEQRAKLVAMARVDSTPYGFAEDIGEIRETLSFLRRPSASLEKLSRKFYRDLEQSIKHRKSKHPDRFRIAARRKEEIVDAAADVWLGYRFAAMPLARSLQEGVEYIWDRRTGSRKLNPPARRTARGFVRDEFDLSGTYVTNWGSATDHFDGRRTGYVEHRAGILYTVKNPVHDIKFHLGIRLKDMPVTAWNLAPLSFMVDRVTDISSAIKALTFLADPSVQVLAAWVTSKGEDKQMLVFNKQVNPGYSVSVNPIPLTHTWHSYDRTPWSPGVLDVRPGFTPKRLIEDATSIADLTALVKKRFALVSLLK